MHPKIRAAKMINTEQNTAPGYTHKFRSHKNIVIRQHNVHFTNFIINII